MLCACFGFEGSFRQRPKREERECTYVSGIRLNDRGIALDTL